MSITSHEVGVSLSSGLPLRQSSTTSTALAVMCGAMGWSCLRFGHWDTSPLRKRLLNRWVGLTALFIVTSITHHASLSASLLLCLHWFSDDELTVAVIHISLVFPLTFSPFAPFCPYKPARRSDKKSICCRQYHDQFTFITAALSHSQVSLPSTSLTLSLSLTVHFIPLQLVQMFKSGSGYCQAPPPGCPREVYAVMVKCW